MKILKLLLFHRNSGILLVLFVGFLNQNCFAAAGVTSIVLSTGTLSPSFSGGTNSYTCSEAYSVSSVTVTPTAPSGTIQVKVNSGSYATVTSASASAALPLNVGSNTILVQLNGSSTYTITVTRTAAGPSNKNGKITIGIDI